MASRKSYLGRTSLTILDSKWVVYFLDDKQYQRLKIKDSRAACVIQGKRKYIYFNCAATFPGDGVVVHELVHAYSRELMGHDLALSPDEREEFFCTLFETRGRDLLRKATPLTHQLMKHAKRLRKPNQEEDQDE